VLTVLFTLAMVQQPAPAVPSGTYTVTFCSSECTEADTSRVLAQGVVVLESAPPRQADPDGDMPACFHIEKKKNVYGYLAVVSPAQTKWWTAPGDSIGFLTYQTHDASHVVLARLTATGFQGSGSSDGEGLAEIDVADEFVVGKRTGPPDSRQCLLSSGKPPGR
jgi:hypothetical protein